MDLNIDEARELYRDADSGHDFDHILRVLLVAERLAEEEGADREIVRAAVLLHDIARLEEDRADDPNLDHAEMAASYAHRFLRAKGASDEFANRVADAIASHRFRGTRRPTTLEAKILFDADKLDALGAIGVARSYAIAGRFRQRLYSEPASDAIALRGQLHANHTPLAEYAVKLSKLPEQMHTATARRLAEERRQFMADFFERLKREVTGDL